MAQRITEIQGTDSISYSRLIINENFNLLDAELLNLESVIDIDSKSIDLSGSSTGRLKANIVQTASLTLLNGSITGTGSINLNGNFFITGLQTIQNGVIRLGNSGSTYLQKESLSLTTGGGAVFNIFNLYGSTAASGKLTDTFDAVVIPRISNSSTLSTVENPKIGSMSYTLNDSSLWICVATGATGEWKKLAFVD